MKKIKGSIEKRTEKAIYFKNEWLRTEIFEGDYIEFKYFSEGWVPLSQVKLTDDGIELPEWLMKKNNFKEFRR